MKKKVAIIMGSQSDARVMKDAAGILKEFKVGFEMKIVSAHRTPVEMQDFALAAESKGYQVIIAGAGGAAHLPGMVASLTPLPVIGVPIALKALKGLDSLLSIAQMPSGVPVATVAIDNATNAALLAIRILALSDSALAKRLKADRRKMKIKVKKSQIVLKSILRG
ncbi:MAG: 5-(carboxyamino)imidazole ribonucleotide mutase [Bdellovibrionales bacterium]